MGFQGLISVENAGILVLHDRKGGFSTLNFFHGLFFGKMVLSLKIGMMHIRRLGLAREMIGVKNIMVDSCVVQYGS